MQLFLGTFSMICSPLFSKQNFPRQRRPGGKGSRKYNVQPRLVEGVWGRSNLPQKKVQQSFLNHSLEPPPPPSPNKKILYLPLGSSIFVEVSSQRFSFSYTVQFKAGNLQGRALNFNGVKKFGSYKIKLQS